MNNRDHHSPSLKAFAMPGLSTRRRVLSTVALGAGSVVLANSRWSKPIVNSIVLPAHAQTSSAACSVDTTVGGPLIGNPAGASTCQAACEAEAASQNAQLCSVREFVDGAGATQCDCDLDLP